MNLLALVLAQLSAAAAGLGATEPPPLAGNPADLIECRFAKAGSLSLADTDAVAVYFAQGLKAGANHGVETFDPASMLSGEIPSDVRSQGDELTLVAPRGPRHPFILLSHDAEHQGDNYSSAKDDLVNSTDEFLRLGFCTRARGAQADARRQRIVSQGERFGKTSA